MNRRDAIKAAGLVVGGAFIASTGVLAACRTDAQTATTRVLSPDDQALFEEIADTLLPTTAAAPGAKAAGVGAAANLILSDCYDTPSQQRVVTGLDTLRAACRSRIGKEFTALARAEREAFLRSVEVEARRTVEQHYFGPIRELALGAYFSSEIGTTKALRYLPVPGRFVGCTTLEPGQRAWA